MTETMTGNSANPQTLSVKFWLEDEYHHRTAVTHVASISIDLYQFVEDTMQDYENKGLITVGWVASELNGNYYG